jgi:Probable zinc-ribbon domain
MRDLKCKDCNNEFLLTDEEVAWYDKKGFPHPKRCKPCRTKNRAQQHIDGKA